jgi:hypothetical protein
LNTKKDLKIKKMAKISEGVFLKKPIFRRRLNNAFLAHRIYSRQILKVKEKMNQNRERVLQDNSIKSNPRFKHFQKKTLQSLETLSINKTHEDKLELLTLQKRIARINIEQEKRTRKNPFFGLIRLIHAGESTRERLINFLKRRKVVKKKNSS